MGVEINTDLDKQIEKISTLLHSLNEVQDKAKLIQFISIAQFAEITGWSIPTVQKLYNRADFPSCDFGKEKMAEVHAVIEYFKVPRRK